MNGYRVDWKHDLNGRGVWLVRQGLRVVRTFVPLDMRVRSVDRAYKEACDWLRARNAEEAADAG